ncbi:MAG: alpha/beta hydrolase family protein [Alphaproteobacteria bacterium]
MPDFPTPPWSRHGKTYEKTLIARGKWIDQNRTERPVPFKIYYPAPQDVTAGEKLPVIIWSHGLGGTRDGAGFISRYLAHFGYIIVHIQHHGTDSYLWEGKAGHPWDNIRAAKIPRKMALQRYQDVPYALKCLKNGTDIAPEILDIMDLSTIGMSGHSFGAGTTQIMAGQSLGRGRRLYHFKHDDFKAGILYSPIPSFNRQDAAETIYGHIDIPLMHMTGTEDYSPVDKTDYKTRLEIFEHVDKAAQHLFILEDGDHMIYSGSRGQLADNVNRERHEELILIASLAFWDAHLHHDQAAIEWLTEGGFSAYLGKDGHYQYKSN